MKLVSSILLVITSLVYTSCNSGAGNDEVASSSLGLRLSIVQGNYQVINPSESPEVKPIIKLSTVDGAPVSGIVLNINNNASDEKPAKVLTNTVTTDSNGLAEISFTAPGFYDKDFSVSATVEDSTTSVTLNFSTVDSSPATRFLLETNKGSSLTAGEPFSFVISIVNEDDSVFEVTRDIDLQWQYTVTDSWGGNSPNLPPSTDFSCSFVDGVCTTPEIYYLTDATTKQYISVGDGLGDYQDAFVVEFEVVAAQGYSLTVSDGPGGPGNASPIDYSSTLEYSADDTSADFYAAVMDEYGNWLMDTTQVSWAGTTTELNTFLTVNNTGATSQVTFVPTLTTSANLLLADTSGSGLITASIPIEVSPGVPAGFTHDTENNFFELADTYFDNEIELVDQHGNICTQVSDLITLDVTTVAAFTTTYGPVGYSQGRASIRSSGLTLTNNFDGSVSQAVNAFFINGVAQADSLEITFRDARYSPQLVISTSKKIFNTSSGILNLGAVPDLTLTTSAIDITQTNTPVGYFITKDGTERGCLVPRDGSRNCHADNDRDLTITTDEPTENFHIFYYDSTNNIIYNNPTFGPNCSDANSISDPTNCANPSAVSMTARGAFLGGANPTNLSDTIISNPAPKVQINPIGGSIGAGYLDFTDTNFPTETSTMQGLIQPGNFVALEIEATDGSNAANTVDATGTYSLTIKAIDALGNHVTTLNGIQSFSFSNFSGGSNSLAGTAPVYANNGNYNFVNGTVTITGLRLPLAGDTLSNISATTGAITSNQISITSVAGDISEIKIRDAIGNGGNDLTDQALTYTADDTIDFYTSGYDSEENFVATLGDAGFSGTINTYATISDFGSTARLYFHTVGSGILTATYNSITASTGTITVNAGVPSYYDVSVTNLAPITVGDSLTVQADLVDADGNIITTDNSSKTLTFTYRDSSNSILAASRYSGPSSETQNLVAGEFPDQTVIFYAAGNSMRIGVDDGTYSGTWTGTIEPGAFNKFIISNASATVTAGASSTQTIQAADQYDNSLTSVNTDVTISLTSSLNNQEIVATSGLTSVNPSSLASGAPYDSVVTADIVNGTGTFDVRSEQIGTLDIQVSTTTPGGINPGTASLTILPDAIVGLRWATGFEPEDQYEATSSNWSTIITELYDQFGNVVNNNNSDDVVISLQGSPTGSLTGTTTKQTAFGQAFFNDINYVKVETITLRATHTDSAFYIEKDIDIIPSNPKRVLLVMQGQTFVEGVTSIGDAVTGTPSAYTVDDTVTYTVDAYVVDEAFNKVENYGGNITLNPEDPNAVITPNGATSFDSTGQASFTVSFRKSGSQKIDLNCNGFFTSSFCHSSSTFTVDPGASYYILPVLPGESFNTTGVATKNLAVSGSPSNNTAGTSFNVDFYLTDKYFNIVNDDSTAVSFSFANDANATGGSGNFTDGQLQLSATNIKAASNLSLAASDIGGLIELSSSTYTVQPANASQYIALLPGESLNTGVTNFAAAKAGSASTTNACTAFDINVYAVDPYFNVDTSDSSAVSMTTSDADDNEASYSGNFSSGAITFSVTPVNLGNTNSFTITSSYANAGSNSTYDIALGSTRKLIGVLPGQTFNPGKLTLGAAVTGSMSPNAVAGDAFNLQVYSVDACHNVDTSSTQSVTITSSDSNDTHTAAQNLSSGTQTFSITNTTAGGSNTLAYSAAGHTSGTSSNYTIDPNDPIQTMAFLPGETHVPGVSNLASAKTGSPTDQTANVDFTATVKLLDLHFNTVTSAAYNGTNISLSTSDTNDSDPSDETTSSGIASFTINNKTAGSGQTLSVTSAYTDQASSSYTVQPGTATQSIVILPGQIHNEGVSSYAAAVTGIPLTQTAGAGFVAQVKAVDDYFNTVTTYSGSISVSTNDTNDTHPAVPNVFSSGVASFTITSTTRGTTHTITPSTALAGDTSSDNFSVVPGSASQAILFLPNDSALNEGAQSLALARTTNTYSVNTATDFNVDAYIVDDYFNIVDDDTTQVTIGFFGDNYATNDGPLTVTDGQAQFTVQNNTAGSGKQILVSTNNGSISSNHGTGSYTVNTGAVSRIVTILPGQSFVEGAASLANARTGSPSLATACVDTYQVTFRAVDSSYNTVTSYNGSFDFTSSDPQDPQTGYTGVNFSSGVATVNLSPSKKDMSTGYTLSLSNTGGLTADTVSNYLVNNGVATKIVTLLPGESIDEGNRTLTKNGSISTITAGTDFTVTTQATDACHNSMGGITPSVTIATEDPYDTEPAAQNLNVVSGAASFTITPQVANTSFPQSGISAHQVTTSVGGYSAVDSSNYTVNVGPKNEVLIVLPGESFDTQGYSTNRSDAVSGTPSTQNKAVAFNVDLYTVDSYYNLITTDSTNINITTSDTSDSDPGAQAMSFGQYNFSVTPVDIQAAANITVTDTDASQVYTSENYVVIDDPPANLSYANAPFTWTKDSAITGQTPTGNTGGAVVSYAVTSGTLPAGINLNTTTGELTGTPTALYTTASVTITATNTGGTQDITFNITVNDVGPSALAYSSATYSWEKNQTVVSETPTSSGGPVVSYAVTSGSLPSGINLNTSTGELTGTPTAVYSTSSVTITATNTGGSDSVTLSLTVEDERPSSLSYANAPFTWTKDSAITGQTPTNAGGTITSYAVTSGSLPTGISLNSTTGELTGTPTALYTTASVTITGTNASGTTDASFNITVNAQAPANLSYASAPFTWTKDSAITGQTPTGNTGGAVVSYAVTSGTLPAGINLNTTTGELTGTPTALYTTASVTITATNTGGTQDITFNITVNDVGPSALAYSSATYSWEKNQTVVSETPTSSGGPVVSYAVTSGSLPSGINLNTSTGELTGTPTAVYSTSSVTITATNTGGSDSVTLSLTVEDERPSSLSYANAPFTWTKDSAITGQTPTNAGGTITSYAVTSGSLPTGISLNSTTGELTGTPTALYTTASVTITGTNASGTTDASFNITVNAQAPANISYASAPFTWTKDSAITGQTPTGNTGGAVVSYAVTSGTLPTGINLNATTGELTGTPTAIYSTASVTITATNTGGTQDITFNISVNDEAPANISYTNAPFTWTKDSAITGQTPTGNTGGAVVSYAVTSGSLPSGINLNTSTGELTGTPTVVYSTSSVTITATNTGGTQDITFNITVNDVAPANLTYSSAPFTWTKDSAITGQTPTGNTGGAVVSYAVTSGSLPSGINLNTSTGELTGTPTAIYSTASATITATNTGGTQDITFNITVNDEAPANLSYANAPFTWTKDSTITGQTPSGNTGGAVVSYAVTSGSLPTGINLNTTTGELTGTPTALYPSASVTITATNTGGTQDITFNITVNDVAPSALAYGSATYSWEKNQTVVSETPTSSGGPVVSYAVTSGSLPSGINLNTTTGELSGTSTVVYSTASVTITATNTGGSDSVTLSLTVEDERPSSLSYTNAPFTWTKDSAITGQTPTNAGGTITNYAVTSGSLPTGISLNSTTGELTGTPTALYTTASVTITGTNASGSTDSSFNITVNAQAPANLSYANAPFTWTKDSVITGQTPSGNTGGAVVSYAVTSGSLPTGINLNTTTGELTGTPTAIYSTSSVTITATNTGGTQDITFNITVNDVAPANLTYSNAPFTWTKDSAISGQTPSGNTGGAVVSYAVTSGSLPSGINLNTSTGELTGTPTAIYSTASVTITATNTGGTQDITFNITVNDVAPANISYTNAPFTWTKDSAITGQTPAGNTGGAVVSYAVTSGALPSGINLNTSTGELTGTPSAVYSTASLTITATNTGGTQDITFNITVNDIAPANLSYSNAPFTWTKDSAITGQTPSGNTGGAVISYAVTSGSLPTGINLNTTTGELTGTPTAVYSNASVTITATNTGGTQDITFNITVNDIAPANLSYSNSPFTWTKDSAITGQTPAGNTGGAVVSYALTSGSLPSGINLNSSTGELTGTPSAVYSTASVTITATNTGGTQDITFNITVNDVAPANLTYSNAPFTWTKDSAITGQTPSGNTGGAVVSYTVTSGSLPSGINLNTSTGELTGTPTAIYSTASVTITATNTGGTQDINFNITVNDEAPANLSYANAPFTWTKESAITGQTPSGNTGGAVVSYAVTSGSLPTGINLNTTTGELTGTPTEIYSTASVTITATNTGGTQDISFNITVQGIQLDKSGDSEGYGSTASDDTSEFIVTNSGSLATATLTTTFTPDDASYWNVVIDNCDSSTLTAASDCNVQITFKGATGNTGSPVSGGYTATLTIDDGDESVTFNLSATIP